MRLIPLTQGKFAMVDDEDFEEINRHEWYVKKNGLRFYAARNVPRPGGGQAQIKMHRQIMNAQPGQEVDHKNGDGLNNLVNNMRLTDKPGNGRGFQRKRIGSSSEFRGVYWHKGARKWKAQLGHDGHKHYLGLFTDEVEAAKAFDKKARELGWPEEGLNFPQEAHA